MQVLDFLCASVAACITCSVEREGECMLVSYVGVHVRARVCC